MNPHPADAPPLQNGETLLWQSRPTWASLWVFIFGVAVCALGPTLGRHPGDSPWLWYALAVVFAFVIVRRRGERYYLTNRRLLVRSRLSSQPAEITLSYWSGLEMRQSLSGRLAGVGHILVRSRAVDEADLVILGQKKPHELARYLTQIAQGESPPIAADPAPIPPTQA